MIKKIIVNKHKELAFLQSLPQPVKELYTEGENLLELLRQPRVAIVGSRRATSYGRQVTTRLGEELASCGVVIVSGLALGIDSIAHQASLDAHGITIAVLPSCLEKIYPASHTSLARRIVEQGGVLVSEYSPIESPPQKHQFIARNRIIAALSQSVVIPEAAARSGSLHTAEFALEQGKDILAVPGNITNPLSEGTNHLIATGAIPVTNCQDILDCLGIEQDSKQAYQPGTRAEAKIIELLQEGVQEATELQLRSQLPPDIFGQTLSMLELKDVISQFNPNHWSLQ